MKFKLSEGKGSVKSFYHNSVNYYPGDTVDLPATYEGVTWLIRLDPVPVVVPPPQKITPIVEAVAPIVEAPAPEVIKPVAAAFTTKKKTTT